MTVDQVLGDVLAKFPDAKRCGAHYQAQCPAHEDRKASLTISTSDHRVLVHCHAGCAFEDVVRAAGLSASQCFVRDDTPPPERARADDPVVATYHYIDETGRPLYDVVRTRSKAFWQRRPDGTLGVAGVRRVLYRLPDLQRKRAVWIVEGEKDADRLAALSLAATTSPAGAGKWRDDFAQQLVAAG